MGSHTISRRAVLVTSGSAALVGATGLVSAGSLDVRTDGASDVTTSSATLHGTLDDLGGHSSAWVQFAYGEAPDSGPLLTTYEELTSTGSFSHGVSNLDPGTTYYFYARAESNDGSEVNTGQTLEFTTDSDDGGDGGGDPGPTPE